MNERVATHVRNQSDAHSGWPSQVDKALCRSAAAQNYSNAVGVLGEKCDPTTPLSDSSKQSSPKAAGAGYNPSAAYGLGMNKGQVSMGSSEPANGSFVGAFNR